MKITSTEFQNGKFIPSKYTCNGENISPPLEISDVSSKAASLILIMDDPDAPMGIWVHWLIWNIDPDTREIQENSVPAGAVQGKNTGGENGYGGPCPPQGTHRYFFRLFALDTKLDLPASTGREELDEAMNGHIIEKTEIFGLYNQR